MLMGSNPLHSLLYYFLIHHDRKLARSKKARAGFAESRPRKDFTSFPSFTQ